LGKDHQSLQSGAKVSSNETVL